MGRKGGSWFSSIKKALSPNSKANKDKKENKSKKWLGNEKTSVSDSLNLENVELSHPHPHPQPHPHPHPHPHSHPPQVEDAKVLEVENAETVHAYSVAVATAAAAEAAAAAAQAAIEVVRLTTSTQFSGKSKEEVAAIKIQTAFRGYLARRALRALRGLVRLKSLVDGPTVKRQTANSLKCLQNLSRVHSQVQSRRIRMLEENRTLQRQILQKRAQELEDLRMGEEWDDSQQTKEKIEANLLHKYEAAMRRERALAYSYTHQQTWKKSTKSNSILFLDPTNPHWGWSWLERWMESHSTAADKDPNHDRSTTKSAAVGNAGEIAKSFARHQLNMDTSSPPTSQKPPRNHHSPATPSKAAAAASSSISTRKLKPPSPRGSLISHDDDSRSMFSIQSERNRRHSIAGSSVRDDESLGSSASVPSYMVPTQSAKAKSKSPSPLGIENGNTPEKSPAGSAKKRLSFPPSPARPRRHSDPPKVSISKSITENGKNGVTS